MTIVGLDIGGANIKAADHTGRAVSRPFAIWRQPNNLKDEIATVLRHFSNINCVALTMTAELADCFRTKADGVRFIVEATERSLLEQRPPVDKTGARVPSPRLVIWTTEGHFVDAQTACQSSPVVAAANWHALATWWCRQHPLGTGLLIDIGTTTTDLIPFSNGRPTPAGKTDVERLQTSELNYSGVRRTPLCALAQSVPFRSGYCSLAAELFATTLDVYLLLGDLAEETHDRETANGRPATKPEAYDRIARMLCGDTNEITIAETELVARFLADVQRRRLYGSMERVLARVASNCQTVLISGSGSFLARRLIADHSKTQHANVILLQEQHSPDVAEAACAYAVAQLALELE